jgi:hypothetical protein
MKTFLRHVTTALSACAIACAAASAQAAPPADAPDCHAEELLAGPWALASSDIQPSTSFTIDGNAINLSWSGYYRWSGTWASGFAGYTFAQPVAIVEGGSYRLTLTVSNLSNPIPAVLRASLSGAGAEQQQSTQVNGTLTFDFTVDSDPGAAPVLDVTAHPALGHIGPLDGIGILIQSYTVTASLVRVR